jgi:polysaccharide export outer membrane protein
MSARTAFVCAIWLLFWVPLGPSGAFAQNRDPDRGGAQGTAKYRIGSGDVLNIEVVGRRDLSASYTVGQDGQLAMPLTGSVPAEGKTAVELSADLARRLSLYDRDITQVNVSVTEYRSRKILVMGAVLHPGKFSFAQPPNAWDAIGEAGGPTENANLSAVEVIPADQTSGRSTQVVDLASAIRDGRVQNLERLKPGDTVRVPSALTGGAGSMGMSGTSSNSVFLFGAINRQGPLPVDRQTDLMTAIAQSGGPAPDANLKAIQIVRRNGNRTVHMKVNLNDYVDKAMISGNPPLMAGDTVFLPRQGSRGFIAVIRTLSPLLAVASTVILIFRK